MTESSTLLGASMLSTLPTLTNSALGINAQNAVVNSDRPDHKVPILIGNEYEWRLDQHWVVTPEVELTAFSKDDSDNNITKGFNK